MFYVHEVRNLFRASNFRTSAWPAGFENFWHGQLAEVAVDREHGGDPMVPASR
jgi:hypothetical protein